jgi:hypothetical protein
MSRFYFHLRWGKQLISDEEGMELPDVMTARQEARESARHILANAIRSSREDIPEEFVISDSAGRELETLPLAMVLPKGLQDEIRLRRSSKGGRMRRPRRAADAVKQR